MDIIDVLIAGWCISLGFLISFVGVHIVEKIYQRTKEVTE